MNMIKYIKLWGLVVWKRGGKLYSIDLGGWSTRNKLMIKIMEETLQDIEEIPPVFVNTADRPVNRYFGINVFSFTTAKGYYDKIIPDWTYDSWIEYKIPEFNKITKEIKEAGYERPLIDKIGWIGNFKTSSSRLKLANLGEMYPQYLDIMDSNDMKYLTLPGLVRTYKYLIDVEGNGFSGRLKYLFFSGRPVFVQERFRGEYALLGAIPYKHYIPIKNDFSDLIEKIEKYFNTELIVEIGKNGQNFAIKNLNKKKAYEYVHNEFMNLKEVKFNVLKVFMFVFFRFVSEIYRSLLVPMWNKLFSKCGVG